MRLLQGLLEQLTKQVALTDRVRSVEWLHIHAPAAALTVVRAHHQKDEKAVVLAGDERQGLAWIHQSRHQSFRLSQPALEEQGLQLRQMNALVSRLETGEVSGFQRLDLE